MWETIGKMIIAAFRIGCFVGVFFLLHYFGCSYGESLAFSVIINMIYFIYLRIEEQFEKHINTLDDRFDNIDLKLNDIEAVLEQTDYKINEINSNTGGD